MKKVCEEESASSLLLLSSWSSLRSSTVASLPSELETLLLVTDGSVELFD